MLGDVIIDRLGADALYGLAVSAIFRLIDLKLEYTAYLNSFVNFWGTLKQLPHTLQIKSAENVDGLTRNGRASRFGGPAVLVS